MGMDGTINHGPTAQDGAEIQCPLLKYWWLSAFLGGLVHTMLSYRCARRKNVLTVINIASAILVLLFSISPSMRTTANVLFSSWNFSLYDQRVYAADILANVSAAFVVISTMLQYYLRYEERHLEHRAAAVEYFNLANKIRRVSKRGHTAEDAHSLNTHLNFLNKGAPGLIRHPLKEKWWTQLVRWIAERLDITTVEPEHVKIFRQLKELESRV
jgi:hypothetical protein